MLAGLNVSWQQLKTVRIFSSTCLHFNRVRIRETVILSISYRIMAILGLVSHDKIDDSLFFCTGIYVTYNKLNLRWRVSKSNSTLDISMNRSKQTSYSTHTSSSRQRSQDLVDSEVKPRIAIECPHQHTYRLSSVMD